MQVPRIVTITLAVVGFFGTVGVIWWLTGPNDSIQLPPASLNDSNIKKLCNLYTRFASQNGNVGPADEATLKEYIRGITDNLTLKVIDFKPADADKLFISGRDNQPFRILYKVKIGTPRGPKPIMCEQTGVGGKREMGYSYGNIEEIDAERFKQMFKR